MVAGAAGHVASQSGSGMSAGAQLAFTFRVSLQPQPMEWCYWCLGWAFPLLLNLFWRRPQRPTQGCCHSGSKYHLGDNQGYL